MPRLSNRPPKYLRHNGNKARVCIDGKFHYLGDYGSQESKQKYNRLCSQWREQQEQNAVALEDRWLIAELAAEYIDYVREYYGDGHNRATSIIPVIRRFGLHFGDKWADEFTPDDLIQARKIWIERNCSRPYINRCTDAIVRAFRWAVTKRKVPASLWQELAAVESLHKGRYGVREAPKVKPVPIHIVDATLPHLPQKIADMVLVQMLSGCRPNEVIRLTPGLIDRSEDVWKYKPVHHKNEWRNKPRTVYFGPQAQAVLRPYLLRPDDQPCFPNKFGQQYARGGYRQVIKRTVDRINKQREKERIELLPQWRPNQLRHLKASQLRELKSLEAARAILGQSSTTVTEIYAELNEREALELTKEFG